MTDLSILDKLRFVASQQLQKKRAASSIVSLSQESSISTQPIKRSRPLGRQISDATTNITHSRPIRRLVIIRQAPVILISSSGIKCGTQTDSWKCDTPPLSSECCCHDEVLKQIRSISTLLTRMTPLIDRSPAEVVKSYRFESDRVQELQDSPAISPAIAGIQSLESSVLSPIETRTIQSVQNQLWYEATIALAADLEVIPRPGFDKMLQSTDLNLKPLEIQSFDELIIYPTSLAIKNTERVVKESIRCERRESPTVRPLAAFGKPSRQRTGRNPENPRRSPRLSQIAEPVPASVVAAAAPPPFGGGCSLLRRIKKAVQSSSLI
jgi:hypothetical protein